MLSRLIQQMSILVFFFLMMYLGVNVAALMYQDIMLQGEAYALSQSMSRFGCYSAESEQHLQNYLQQRGINPSTVQVQVTPSFSVARFGEKVSITLSHPYRQTINIFGENILFSENIIAKSSMISMFIPGFDAQGNSFAGAQPVR